MPRTVKEQNIYGDENMLMCAVCCIMLYSIYTAWIIFTYIRESRGDIRLNLDKITIKRPPPPPPLPLHLSALLSNDVHCT